MSKILYAVENNSYVPNIQRLIKLSHVDNNITPKIIGTTNDKFAYDYSFFHIFTENITFKLGCILSIGTLGLLVFLLIRKINFFKKKNSDLKTRLVKKFEDDLRRSLASATLLHQSMQSKVSLLQSSIESNQDLIIALRSALVERSNLLAKQSNLVKDLLFSVQRDPQLVKSIEKVMDYCVNRTVKRCKTLATKQLSTAFAKNLISYYEQQREYLKKTSTDYNPLSSAHLNPNLNYRMILILSTTLSLLLMQLQFSHPNISTSQVLSDAQILHSTYVESVIDIQPKQLNINNVSINELLFKNAFDSSDLMNINFQNVVSGDDAIRNKFHSIACNTTDLRYNSRISFLKETFKNKG